MKNYTKIIVGGGIASIQLAKHLNPESRVLLITKSSIHNSNSYRAQGGIAAAIGANDKAALHLKDTLLAGCSFNNDFAVKTLTEAAPNIIRQLQKDGLQFDRNSEGALSLGMEGAHSRHRIVHCGGDATGKHVVDHLLNELSPNVDVLENAFVYELIIHPNSGHCVGVKVKDEMGENHIFYGNQTILAAGGIGSLYSYTSNDSTVTGDGIALAYDVGAELVDMEFIQFHPTLLYVDGQTCGLISEAVRGEGALLVNESGKRLMKHHELGDLAPRHIVAKEIYEQRLKKNNVYLDISMIDNFKKKFPTITQLCETKGVLIEEGRIPVAPGCHFLMGGVRVNENGETTIKELFAIGEVAATGVHGANRLASNSLLEALHYGKSVANYLNDLEHKQMQSIAINYRGRSNKPVKLPSKIEIQDKMMAYAGIMRTEKDLIKLRDWLQQYDTDLETLDYFSLEDSQVVFMLKAAKVITNAALLREESRGAHFREDFPYERDDWKDVHIVQSTAITKVRRETNEQRKIKVHA